MPSQNGDSKLRLRSHAITERRFKVTVMVTCSDTRILWIILSHLGIVLPPSSPQLRLKTRRLVSSSPPAPPNRHHFYVIPSVATEDTPTCFLVSAGRRLRIDIISTSSPQLRLLARYADLYLRLRRRLRIDVTGYLRRHPLSCDFLRDTPTRILVSVGASESTSLDISARRFKSHLKCTFLTFSTQSTNDRSSAEPQKCRSSLSRWTTTCVLSPAASRWTKCLWSSSHRCCIASSWSFHSSVPFPDRRYPSLTYIENV